MNRNNEGFCKGYIHTKRQTNRFINTVLIFIWNLYMTSILKQKLGLELNINWNKIFSMGCIHTEFQLNRIINTVFIWNFKCLPFRDKMEEYGFIIIIIISNAAGDTDFILTLDRDQENKNQTVNNKLYTHKT